MTFVRNYKNMHFTVVVLLLHASLVGCFLDSWGINNEIELIADLTKSCEENLQTSVFLTYGMGVADASVVIISDNNEYPNCMITFYTSEGLYLIAVVEFPDRTVGAYNACQNEGSTIIMREPIKGNVDVCVQVNLLSFEYFETPIYSAINNASNVSMIIETISLFETVKITVTAAKRLKQYEKCDDTKEIPCTIANISVCISKEFLCDSNLNCGTVGMNDEDERICDEGKYRRLWLVVLSGTIMFLTVIFFCVHLFQTCLPKIPDSFFIFNEDEDNKLILATQYIAPVKRSLPQSNTLQTNRTSSFKFRSIPVTSLEVPAATITLLPPKQEFDTKANFESRESISWQSNEIEIESHIYKDEMKKEPEHADNISLQKLGKDERGQEAKRTKFRADSIHIGSDLSDYRPGTSKERKKNVQKGKTKKRSF